MPTGIRPVEIPRILDLNQQVLLKKDWLPQGLFPDLDELRAEHNELVSELENAAHVRHRMEERYKAEDTAREAAALALEDPPPVTGSAERKDRLEEVRALVQARMDRLGAFVDRAIAVIKEKGAIGEFPDQPGALPEWRIVFAALRAEAESEIQKAEEALRAAEGREAAIKGNERWLDKTVKATGGVYLAASQFPPLMTRAEWDADKVPPALSGMGMVS